MTEKSGSKIISLMGWVTIIHKDHGIYCDLRMEGFSWWIHQEGLGRLKEEIIPCLSQPELLSGFSLLKKTDTRLIFRVNSEAPGQSFIIKLFKNPQLIDNLKYFFRPSRSRKEWRIGHELFKRSISTPPLVASGVSRKFGFLRKDYIISREITGAKPLIIWVEENLLPRSISRSEKKKVIHGLALFVRRIHDRGIYSSDFHQGNILIRTEKNKPPVFYLIDLHSIRIKREVTIHNRINNLVQLNNFRISMPDRLRFVKAYLQEGGLKGVSTEDLIRKIASVSSTHWHHLWKKRKRKCLRPRKEVERWKVDSWTGMVQKAYSSSLSQVFERMDVNFQGTESKNIKKTSQSSVKEIVLSQERKSQSLIVKEYKSINLLPRLKAVFRISKARRAWINANNLIMRGIPTPEPVAFGEKKRWGIVQESFFITEKIPEAEASDFYLKELSGNLRDSKKEFLIRLARQIRWMHQTGICHGDLKASNILVTITEEKPVIFLVDTDGVKIRNKLGVKEIAKDLSRLRAAFSGMLFPSEHEYFLAIYGRGNRFFQGNKKKIMKKVHALTDKKIQQKQKNKVSIRRKDAEDAKGR